MTGIWPMTIEGSPTPVMPTLTLAPTPTPQVLLTAKRMRKLDLAATKRRMKMLPKWQTISSKPKLCKPSLSLALLNVGGDKPLLVVAPEWLDSVRHLTDLTAPTLVRVPLPDLLRTLTRRGVHRLRLAVSLLDPPLQIR
ncbi:hypothetical protein PF010_g19177 [Phytophthora fragariae]|uniref:Uncharacterized protein n=1 Tax=Phytophthora fragariae TaxID=53985 RepID=A0A6A4CUA7_9STRA|nr:hypothetical protein PF003_g38167 [Phytophthora fragariae]KAE8931579.1 hypothetical protein PF009_g18359 [Phytophthora fragariae]KAE9085901.1 hypothetical protein PF007_g20968 [Phytophthora fragariae]KAE9088969.1 hypothetical protein PF010_g19177 [Phytophthora fragariae]KAE9116241.1 hypothetical protein PF006_g19085 [Phytophthora fragariae]